MPDNIDRFDGRRAGYPAPSGSAGDDDPAAIRAEIERTRERMERTVDELGYRLNPDRLKGRIKRNLHDATVGKAEHMAMKAIDRADETRHSMMDTLRDNPIPAAMVGIGLGWLMVNARRDDERDYRSFGEPIPRGQGRRVEMGYTTLETDTAFMNDDLSAQRYRAGIDLERSTGGAGGRVAGVGEAAREWGEDLSERARDEAHRAKDRVTEVALEARDTTRDLADRARDRIDDGTNRARSLRSDFARRTRSGAGRVEHRFDDALHDSPLAIGAAAVALGMAVGLTVPTTDREAKVLGPKRDELMDRARHEADEMKGRARNVAERVVDEVRTTAREAAREEGFVGDRATRDGEPFGTPTGF